MYKSYCIFVFRLWLLFCSYGGFAASDDFKWLKGEVILTDSSRLSGELSVNYSLDLLLMKKEGSGIQVFPAHKVLSFILHDDEAPNLRQFITRPYQSVKGLKGAAFFEIVGFGPLTVLRREKTVHRLGPHRSICPEYSDHTFKKSKTNKYVYFILNGSVLTDFITFQKRLSEEVFAEYREEIRSFMKGKSLRRWKHGDFTYAIRCYNALKLRDQSPDSNLAFAHPGL